MSSIPPTEKPVSKLPDRPILPTYSWRTKSSNAQLFYIRDHHHVNLTIPRLRNGPLGFDLEWRPNFIKGQLENPVALVQLSNEDTILLIQISAMTEFPNKLRELLEDPGRVKAGVGIQHDCKKLYADWSISVRNCVDLSLLARCVDNARWKGRYVEPIGLGRLVETYEKLSLPKGKIQRSNWEAQLSTVQQDYAANDAHSGFVIFNRFAAMAHVMDSVPNPTYYSFNAINGCLLDSSGVPWNPSNPEYDPGPPLPPKPPKPPRTPKATTTTDVAAVKASTSISIQVNRSPHKPGTSFEK
ncbi:hypothetical protein PILCRDRAFT_367306 [Piloderma croceum F 1598]|uniref:3'-5' exonuclease n=1 Tax=Piloderma croceum (strain F 1598) TaxID=765440 RepID=A0A0C3FMX3_PILCF|nr:hypothetical protein PILCRDRAFT_367306 [Piloderma croceum F 1598]